MSIKITSSIEEAYVSQLNSFKSAAAGTSGEAVSFSDALASAKELLEGQDLSDAQKNAIRAVTVDAAIDAIQLSGGYGLSLDSDLAKSLGISQSTASTSSETTDTSSLEVETASEAAARNATTEAAKAAAASESSDDSAVSEETEETAASASSEETDNTESGGTASSSSYTTSLDIGTVSVDAGDLACSDTLNDYFEEASETYDVDIKLLKSIAVVESDFDENCTSGSGAMGIMQLMPDTAKELGVDDAYDPYQNIMGGAKYISQLLEKFDGDIALAAAAYNAGPGAVAKCGGIPSSSQNYVQKVLSYYNS